MKKIYFICGSQDLYGEEVIKQVEIDSKAMVSYLNEQVQDLGEIVYGCTVTTSIDAAKIMQQASYDDDCVGVIVWMHTFSPAKMWIRGLQILNKPLLHLHTQYNERLPYETIDMDFMNLNQSAHGDREFSFILRRLNIEHAIAVGYYKNASVIKKIRQFMEVARAIDYSRHLRAATFGNNMRDVAVTDGDRVESQIRLGWEVNYYGIGDLVQYENKVTEVEEKLKMEEYINKYRMNTDKFESVKKQARYEVALEKFFRDERIHAFTDTFQDLHGLEQLPGLAVQNIMSTGIGFGPEGDYKTACLGAVLMKMSEKRDGATGFIEDYTYDLVEGHEVELGSHMLEVPPVFAKSKPAIEVHHLGIGGKNPPARLVFDSIEGKAIQVTMVDLGTHFKIIAMPIELVSSKEMPKLPVARVMYKILPTFEKGLEFWLRQGGGHHAVISTSLTMEDLALFCKLMKIEFEFIQ